MKHSIFFLLALTGFSITSIMSKKKNKKQTGTVLVLNGPSASGKSSIQKEFQNIMMPNLWIKVGIDNLFDKPMPDITLENLDYWKSQNPTRWIETSQNSENKNIIKLFVGPEGEKVAYAMNSAIAAYAANGCNVIVDYIAYKQEWLTDLQKKLKHFTTYYVKVEIPLNTLEEREKARGTSPVGHARSHYHSVYGDINYDLIVNSETNSALHIAEQLKQLIHKN